MLQIILSSCNCVCQWEHCLFQYRMLHCFCSTYSIVRTVCKGKGSRFFLPNTSLTEQKSTKKNGANIDFFLFFWKGEMNGLCFCQMHCHLLEQSLCMHIMLEQSLSNTFSVTLSYANFDKRGSSLWFRKYRLLLKPSP